MAVIVSQIKEIMPETALSSEIITSLIADATTYVNSVLAGYTGMTSAEIDVVIKWFTCHMIASGPERQAKREKLGEAEVDYGATASEGLESTTYGRMAVTMDRSGLLKASGGKRAISIKAVTSFEE